MTRRMISVVTAILFSFGFVVVPALAEKPQDKGQPAAGNGGSGGGGSKASSSSNGDTQGGSESNPDGGGVDKPYPADGQPAMSQGESDWDGNNGCGNDDDREDDNNGWCGKKPSNDNDNDNDNDTEGDTEGDTTGGGSTPGGSPGDNTSGSAGGFGGSDTQISGAIAAAAGLPTGRNAEVMGTSFSRRLDTAGSAYEVLGVKLTRGEPLPVTGSETGAALALAAGLILAGSLMVARTRRTENAS